MRSIYGCKVWTGNWFLPINLRIPRSLSPSPKSILLKRQSVLHNNLSGLQHSGIPSCVPRWSTSAMLSSIPLYINPVTIMSSHVSICGFLIHTKHVVVYVKNQACNLTTPQPCNNTHGELHSLSTARIHQAQAQYRPTCVAVSCIHGHQHIVIREAYVTNIAQNCHWKQNMACYTCITTLCLACDLSTSILIMRI